MHPSDIEATRRAGERLRHRLLDLSRRNSSISFSHSSKRRDQIRVIDELPNVLFEAFTKGRSLPLAPLPDPRSLDDEQTPYFQERLDEACYNDPEFLEKSRNWEDAEEADHRERVSRRLRTELGWPSRENRGKHRAETVARILGMDPTYDLPDEPWEEDRRAARHTDNRIQTLLFPDQLERATATLFRKNRLILSESGVQALYAAFGFLAWQPPKGTEPVLSPLILVPIRIERGRDAHGFTYRLEPRDDDIRVNPSLAAALDKFFGLRLDDPEPEQTPEGYLAELGKRLKPEWKLYRYITISLFSFSRVALYQDLDPARWPRGADPWHHETISHLLHGRERIHEARSTLSGTLPLIAPADSSQARAIQAVLSGRNLVIEGPPGTGKSQTITNLIAACLSKGKRVLFVAEKMAALEVVQKRLDAAGLTSFCLDLHSRKADKKSVYAHLRARLELEPKAPLDEDSGEVTERLSRYHEALHAPIATGLPSFHEVVWSLSDEAVALPQSITRIRLVPDRADPSTWLVDRGEAVSAYAEAWQAFLLSHGAPNDHPWAGLTRWEATEENKRKLITLLEEQQGLVDEACRLAEALPFRDPGCGPHNRTDMAALCDDLDNIPHIEAARIDGALFSHLADPDNLSLAALASEALSLRAELRQAIPDLTRANEAARAAEMKQVARTLQEIGGGLENLTEATAMRDRLTHQLERVQATRKAARAAASLMGIDGRVDTESLALAMRAIDLAEALPSDQTAYLSPSVLDPAHEPELEEAAGRHEAIERARDALAERLVTRPEHRIEDLREAAETFRTTPWWKPVARRRVAMGLWRSLNRGGLKLNRFQRAVSLDELADLGDAAKRLEEDHRIQQACAPHFRGLDTPFQTLVRVNQWGRRVRTTIPRSSPTGAAIQQRLLAMSPSDFLELAALRRDADGWVAWRELVESGPAEGLDDRIEALQARCRRANELVSRLIEIGWPPSLPLRFLPETSIRLAHLARLSERLRDGPEWLVPFLEDRGDRPGIDRARQAAETLHEAELTGEISDYLFHAEVRDRLAALARWHRSAGAVEKRNRVLITRLREGYLIDERVWCEGERFESWRFDAWSARLKRTRERVASLDELLSFLSFEQTLREKGLAELVDAFHADLREPTRFRKAYERVRLLTLRDMGLQRYQILRTFAPGQLETLREEWIEHDRQSLRRNATRIVEMLASTALDPGSGRGPRKQWTGLALIHNEVGKQRRHLPIRTLVRQGGKTLFQLTPCLLMSPLSTAQYLPPDPELFDIVVMDEASQMRPEDAMSAIARARQLVVVGDARQLGPTRFFDTADPGEDEETAFESSILEMAAAVYAPTEKLSWHYRSRHPSLIERSNRLFYDASLRVFPCADHEDPSLGFHVHFVSEGVYVDRRNEGEADRIIEAAMRIMAEEPTSSLGIVAVNQAQQTYLEEALETRIATDDRAGSYLQHWETTLEPLFIKNLENVQGDERDIILVSTVYGRGPDGRFVRRLGPINSADGYRRLNVLFTRARQRLELYTSMTPEMLSGDGTNTPSMEAFRSFLDQRQAPIESTTGTAETPFHKVLGKHLERRGFSVIPAASNTPALMVRDPHLPTRFSLGITADLDPIDNGFALRDHERGTSEVLASLGWSLLHIRSIDWARNPRWCLREILDRLRSAGQNGQDGSSQDLGPGEQALAVEAHLRVVEPGLETTTQRQHRGDQ